MRSTYDRYQMTHFPPVLTLDSPLCQLCRPSFLLYPSACPLLTIQESLLSSWPWACGWPPVPAPGTPNGSCNYHCSTAVLSVRSPAKQEGILWKSRSKALAFDHEAKGKNLNNVQDQRGMSQREPRPEDILRSSSAAVCWCQGHRCLGCVWFIRRRVRGWVMPRCCCCWTLLGGTCEAATVPLPSEMNGNVCTLKPP